MSVLKEGIETPQTLEESPIQEQFDIQPSSPKNFDISANVQQYETALTILKLNDAVKDNQSQGIESAYQDTISPNWKQLDSLPQPTVEVTTSPKETTDSILPAAEPGVKTVIIEGVIDALMRDEKESSD